MIIVVPFAHDLHNNPFIMWSANGGERERESWLRATPNPSDPNDPLRCDGICEILSESSLRMRDITVRTSRSTLDVLVGGEGTKIARWHSDLGPCYDVNTINQMPMIPMGGGGAISSDEWMQDGRNYYTKNIAVARSRRFCFFPSALSRSDTLSSMIDHAANARLDTRVT